MTNKEQYQLGGALSSLASVMNSGSFLGNTFFLPQKKE